MKKLVVLSISLLALIACDDGDIIVSDFNFNEESSLNLCEFDNNRKVLHIVTESNEAIAFTFQQDILENIIDVINPDNISVPINNSNLVNFRRLDANVNSDEYFCVDIPPSQPNVLEEYESTSGGSVEFTITRVSGPEVDTDGDGIPDIEERQVDESGNFTGTVFNLDTDEDGIPNFLDIDDDNDNIPTISELNAAAANEINADTDGDGIPNYLDADDDGDGVITRYEDLNALDNGTPPSQTDLNPRNDDTDQDGIPNYLDATVSESLVVDYFRDNRVSRRFDITVVFNNITLKNTASEQTIRLDSQGFGVFSLTTDDEVLSIR
ncbi:hypothetical protein [Psychroflexus sediminis]|uniref:Thrombospondin type 3 repeat-containing protein n=1 Tax=Psychroflexus sediminis TaxID=470826 RepID=A0A1G7WVM5_9FLAO|nr:hypothetical protein [Psychroflexus sediminis]SDG75973.1 hypothetical protein SAMN04488027_106159 [Psychroflexus sediminis]